ncbi:imidazole glycerol phosphate synthase subunit HisH [Candidatus Woesearchaeota archaeon]|nr:imidazole glycerol phosphate synthase subunit HisH [Candidatus Woesearchaeota archaeon]
MEEEQNKNSTKDTKKHDILVIDYHVGNHRSVLNALSLLGYHYKVSSEKEEIAKAPAYILPGVGAFSEAMTNLQNLGIIDTLKEQILNHKKPILGICLGMQVLAESSTENGFHKGLGIIKGSVMRIDSHKDIKIPHVGWNNLSIHQKDPLFTRTDEEAHFYFDHSYHIACDHSIISATCTHGSEITAAIQSDNIFGVQFHPEKSQKNGLLLLRGFFNYIKQRESKNA